jgi:hypothetical protein
MVWFYGMVVIVIVLIAVYLLLEWISRTHV